MVGRKKKHSRQRTTLGNHQRSWIWGRHAVLETLRAGRWKPEELLIADALLTPEQLHEATELARSHRIPLELQPAESLEKVCHARDHQGFAARMPEFPYSDPAELVGSPAAPSAFLLILDRLQDPFNFGSILRSADLFGVTGILIRDKEQVGVTSHVARSSAGAVNYLRIYRVPELPEICHQLAATGHQIVVTSEKSETSSTRIDFRLPTAIVIGNEGEGVDPELITATTQTCAIPQVGHIDSLNAAVAAGIFCYEVSRQRQ